MEQYLQQFQHGSKSEQTEAAYEYAAAAMAGKRMAAITSNLQLQQQQQLQQEQPDIQNRPNSNEGIDQHSHGGNIGLNTGISTTTDLNNSLASQAGNFNLTPYNVMLYPTTSNHQAQAQQLLLNGLLTNGMIGSSLGGPLSSSILPAQGQGGQGLSQGQIAPSQFQMSMNSGDSQLTKKIMAVGTSSGKKKKDKQKPKRPLSAYNWFFKYERARILESKDENAGQKEKTTSKDVSETDKSNSDSISNSTTVKVKVEDEETAQGEKQKGASPLASSNEDSEDNKSKTTGSEEVPASSSSSSSQQKDKVAVKDEPENVSETPTVSESTPKKKKPHGKIGFENLAKTIGRRWAELDKEELVRYKKLADEDMKRYKKEMEVYLTKLQQIEAKEQVQAIPSQVQLDDSMNRGGNNSQASNFNLQSMNNGDQAQFLTQNQQLQLQLQSLQQQQQLQQQLQQIQQLQRLQQQNIQAGLDDNNVPAAKKQRTDNDLYQSSQNFFGGQHTDDNLLGQSSSNSLIQHYFGGFNTGTSQNQAESLLYQDGSNANTDNMSSGNTYTQGFDMGN